MPNFPVPTSPIRISQSLTQPALLQNVGTETIYLDGESSVSSASYGLGLVPRSTVNWPADRELWAMVETGEGTLSVLYNADGAGLAEITATIDGDVTIGAPVQVQGGGEILVEATGSLTPGGGVTIEVPAPANGLTYFGIAVIVSVTSKTVSNDVPLVVSVYNFGPNVSPTAFQPVLRTSAAPFLGEFGHAESVGVVMPVGSSFPIDVDLNHNGAGGTGTQNYEVVVVGLSYADTFPRDFGQWENGVETEVSFDAALVNSYAVLAASFETRQYLLSSATGTTGNFVVKTLTSSGTWAQSQIRAHNNLYGGNTGAATIQANTNSVITIPGDGRAHRIETLAAVTGTVRLAYLGKA